MDCQTLIIWDLEIQDYSQILQIQDLACQMLKIQDLKINVENSRFGNSRFVLLNI